MAAPTGTAIELYRKVGEGGQLSGLDSRLLALVAEAGGRISGEELSEKLGGSISPARCLQRVREILKSQDILSITEQKSLLLLDVIRLRDILFDRVEGTETRITKHGDLVDVESSPAWANALVRLLREWRTTIDSMRSDIDGDQLLIREAHAKIMLDAIETVFLAFITRLDRHFQNYKEPPTRSQMEEMLEDALPLGFQALERKTAA